MAAASAPGRASSGDIVDQILGAQSPQPANPAAPMASAPPAAAAPMASAPPAAPTPLTSAPPAAAAPVTLEPPAAAAPSFSPNAAADVSNYLPPSPVPNWAGFYVGGNFGWGNTHGGTGTTCSNVVTGDSTGCVIIGDSGFNTSGVFGGGQVGYQRPAYLSMGVPLIVGGEVDLQGTGISGSQSNSGPFLFSGFPGVTCSPCGYTASQKIDWFSTFRVRVGVPIDRFLIYATGGLIVGGVATSQVVSFNGTPGYVANDKSDKFGPIAGAGVEFLATGPWSIRAEAFYYDLGDVRSVAAPQQNFAGNFSNTRTFGVHGGLFRLGVNYQLGDFNY